jgi:hypothetical protein
MRDGGRRVQFRRLEFAVGRFSLLPTPYSLLLGIHADQNVTREGVPLCAFQKSSSATIPGVIIGGVGFFSKIGGTLLWRLIRNSEMVHRRHYALTSAPRWGERLHAASRVGGAGVSPADFGVSPKSRARSQVRTTSALRRRAIRFAAINSCSAHTAQRQGQFMNGCWRISHGGALGEHALLRRGR